MDSGSSKSQYQHVTPKNTNKINMEYFKVYSTGAVKSTRDTNSNTDELRKDNTSNNSDNNNTNISSFVPSKEGCFISLKAAIHKIQNP